MNIENIYYVVVSRGKDHPEILPKTSDIFDLSVIPENAVSDGETLTATIHAENVERLGPYSHVIGRTKIADRDIMPGEARYAINGEFPIGSHIGELILKKVTG